MDNGSLAKFEQNLKDLTVKVDCPKYKYGDNFVIRVAKCKI